MPILFSNLFVISFLSEFSAMSSLEEVKREMKRLEEQFAKELEEKRKKVEAMEERARILKERNEELERLLQKLIEETRRDRG